MPRALNGVSAMSRLDVSLTTVRASVYPGMGGHVLIVSFVSLGWRVGIVVAAAVPLTLAAVFVIMMYTGRNFDRITLGALILALGLLVDDAIIAIETMVVMSMPPVEPVSSRSW